jgi:hypothetical protein
LSDLQSADNANKRKVELNGEEWRGRNSCPSLPAAPERVYMAYMYIYKCV